MRSLLGSSNASSASLRILLVTVIALSVIAMVSGGYLGPRYGKRLPSGQRTIQSRSQARFYAGSRYGGKRSYGPNSAPDAEGGEQTSPYDCFFVPFIGVRCALRSEEGGVVRGDNTADSDDYGPSMIRTTLIGDRGSVGGGGRLSGPSSPAIQSVLGSEA